MSVLHMKDNTMNNASATEGSVRTLVTGTWMHLFGAGTETRCRVVIDLTAGTLVAAQAWTGLKFERLRGDQLKDLAESVIEVNAVHLSPNDLGDLELTEALPDWAIDHGSAPAPGHTGTANVPVEEARAIPPRAVSVITFYVEQLVEDARALGSVQRARGNGYFLALELSDRRPRIQRSYAKLTEFFEVSVELGADEAFLKLVTDNGLPDLKPYGLEAAEIPPWAHLHPETELQCSVLVRGQASDPDDEGLAGEYPYLVTLLRPVRLAELTDADKSQIAKAVLDEFHSRQGIEVLDDFEIQALLPNGAPICESDELEVAHLVGGVR